MPAGLIGQQAEGEHGRTKVGFMPCECQSCGLAVLYPPTWQENVPQAGLNHDEAAYKPLEYRLRDDSTIGSIIK